MEAIRNYVEALFASLPQTAEILRLKIDMLAGLEEKYNALRAEGKGEHEAVGLVVASIGSADDLRAELGLDGEYRAAEAADAPLPSGADAALQAEYYAFKSKMGSGIAAAVALFILSPVILILGENAVSEGFGMLLFFLFIAAGTSICIIYGVRQEYYREMLGLGKFCKRNGHDPAAPHGRMTKLFSAIAFPIAAVIYLCLGFFGGWWHPGWLIFVLCAVLSGAVAAIEEYRRN
ncbi:MAG: permease prefix domain 1-containing protein [Eubacteriales bacterium]|nr:permease prefix domain 1-containing protein [Eubacteriales bacterium]